jgi:hypothetical protein
MRPAALIDEVVDWWFACAPSLAIETRVVVPLPRSWTKTSAVLLVSPATRLAAVDEKVTEVPSLLTAGYCAAPMPWVPSLATDTRVVVPVTRSCRNTSPLALVSPGTRFDAADLKATWRPSLLIAGESDGPSAWVPSLATETRVVVPVSRSWTNTSVQ